MLKANPKIHFGWRQHALMDMDMDMDMASPVSLAPPQARLESISAFPRFPNGSLFRRVYDSDLSRHLSSVRARTFPSSLPWPIPSGPGPVQACWMDNFFPAEHTQWEKKQKKTVCFFLKHFKEKVFSKTCSSFHIKLLLCWTALLVLHIRNDTK